VIRFVAGAALLFALGCTTLPGAPEAPQGDRCGASPPALRHARLDPEEVHVEPEGITVEDNFVLDLYTWLHDKGYSAERVRFPGTNGEEAIAHLLVPAEPGPHPLVVVFPILAGSHVVSEGLAKALVNRRYAVLRLERRPLDFERAEGPEEPMRAFRESLLDARRALDWAETREEIDPERIAAAGVSLGGMLGASLLGADPRVRAGFFVMAGGGLAELLHDSAERPVRSFRERVSEEHGFESREQFVALLEGYTHGVDPLLQVCHVDPERVLLVSGRFDRVVPAERTRALWEAFGRPTWIRLPVGHYQLGPLFWWSVGRGADHLDRVLVPAGGSASIRTGQ
jgi:pimeloyl-ACP methyl ester carboxylesterase